jgi:transcriptional regulator with XRE-family HTH domain
MYNEKLRLYFKKIGVSQQEAAKRLGHAPAMMSRYLSGVSVFDANFVVALVREFPEVDLKYIFSDQKDAITKVAEATIEDGVKEDDEIEKELQIIEEKLTSIRSVLARKGHGK